MDRKYALMYVLSAIVVLNIVAIMLLSNKIAQDREASEQGAQPPAQQPIVIAGEPKPLVRTLILEDRARCPDCFDVRLYLSQLEGVLNMSVEEGDREAFERRLLAESRVLPVRWPAVAFNASIEEYPDEFVAGWEGYGYTLAIPEGEYAGLWYLLPTLNPPYIDASGSVVGRVDVTYLTMESCEECYDVSINRAFLEASRIVPHSERTIDVESAAGRAIAQRYGITAVPTILLSEEADAYANLKPGWPTVGTVEEDGTYVLRELQRLKVTYYDLATGEVMRP